MPDERASVPSPERLSEDAAHRLLARAIELDHFRSAETTVDMLREVAREAGISAEAFEAAFRELSTPTVAKMVESSTETRPRFATRFWRRMRGANLSPQGVGEALVSNAIAFVVAWVLAFFLTRIATGIGWQAMAVAILISCALGVGIARRLRARIVEIGLMGMVAFQASEFAMHLLFGIRAVQGGATHWAVITAGILGATIAWAVHRRRDEPLAASSKVAAVQSPATVTATWVGAPPDSEHPMRSLRLGLGLRNAAPRPSVA